MEGFYPSKEAAAEAWLKGQPSASEERYQRMALEATSQNSQGEWYVSSWLWTQLCTEYLRELARARGGKIYDVSGE
jgi:hypothetical protein